MSTVEAYNPVTGELTPLACMKNSRSRMGIAVLHDYIYVVGGIGVRSQHMTAVERYSIKEVRFESVREGEREEAATSCARRESSPRLSIDIVADL